MASQEIVVAIQSGVLAVFLWCQTLFQALGIVPSPCANPLPYTIGVVDSRFNISKEEVLRATQEAEALWETQGGKDLFVYRETEGIPITLVYDERQARTEAGQRLEAKLGTLNLDENQATTKRNITLYQEARSKYENLLAIYQQRLTTYNQEVSRANARGGATEKEGQQLENERQRLQAEFLQVEQARGKVNSLASSANQSIKESGAKVEAYNKEVGTFQEKYGGEGQSFDQGVYTGDAITIYQYDDYTRLVLVLAHEMGHAIGLDHGENPKSLMYYLMKEQNIQTLQLSYEDKAALESICTKPGFPW
jgi:hypothetical protein